MRSIFLAGVASTALWGLEVMAQKVLFFEGMEYKEAELAKAMNMTGQTMPQDATDLTITRLTAHSHCLA
jgi:hypothetical protein